MKIGYFLITSALTCLAGLSSCAHQVENSSLQNVTSKEEHQINVEIKKLEQEKKRYQSYARHFSRAAMRNEKGEASAYRQNLTSEAKYNNLVIETEKKIQELKKKNKP